MNNNEFVVDICIYWNDRCDCSRVSDFHCTNVDEILKWANMHHIVSSGWIGGELIKPRDPNDAFEY